MLFMTDMLSLTFFFTTPHTMPRRRGPSTTTQPRRFSPYVTMLSTLFNAYTSMYRNVYTFPQMFPKISTADVSIAGKG